MIGLAALGGCAASTASTTRATVDFLLQPHACSSTLPVQFTIDDIQVGSDTFKIAVAGGDHLKSRAFVTSAGAHTLSARVMGGYVWADKQVTVAAGDAVTDTLPFSCS
jgi:hypothetical protein